MSSSYTRAFLEDLSFSDSSGRFLAGASDVEADGGAALPDTTADTDGDAGAALLPAVRALSAAKRAWMDA
jgi:hypothetical protein